MSENQADSATFSASIKDLLASAGSANTSEKGVLPLLTELADKHQQSSVLIQKAMLLLGLADKFKGTARGQQLQKDAEEFLSFAHELQSSDEANKVIERAQAFTNTVSDKYEKHGKELFEQTQKVWDDVMQSGEAKEFLSVGSSVLKDWDAYGGSAEGKAIIDSIKNQVMSLVDNKGASLLDLVQEYSSDADAFIANSEKHKKTLMEAVGEVEKIIEEDEELKEWMSKGKVLISQKVEKLEAVDTNALEAQADDKLATMATQGKDVLTKIQESEVGKDLLKKGTEVLSELKAKGDLDPRQLIENVKKFREEPSSRQEVITKIKDTILDYLLEFIPKIRMDNLKGENDLAQFEFNNVSMEGFKLRTKDVDVNLDDNGIIVRAKNITCHLRDMKWWCKAKTFPYMSTSGIAEAVATKCSFEMRLSVERAKREGEDKEKKEKKDKPVEKVEDAQDADASHEKKGQEVAEAVEDVLEVFDYDYTVVVAPLEIVEPETEEDEDEEEVWETPARPRYVKMPYLEVEIGGSWLSGVYNFLLTYFSDFVRQVVEDKINDALHEKSSVLVEMINKTAKEYLPLIASLKRKVVEKAPHLAKVVVKAGEGIQENMRVAKEERERDAALASPALASPLSDGALSSPQSPDDVMNMPKTC